MNSLLGTTSGTKANRSGGQLEHFLEDALLWRGYTPFPNHRGPEPLILEPRTYEQHDHYKPNGLWVSVPGGDDWPSWCRAEQWGDLTCCTNLTLKQDHNLLMIDTLEKLREFDREFSTGRFDGIDWSVIARRWGGIIIAPYQWAARYDLLWYYGWDCASGCIWDLSNIT